MNNIQKATQEYLNRKNRKSHPSGNFDDGGRFYLSDEERHDCCSGIRTPSRRFPYSEMVHGRTMKHVASIFNVCTLDIRRELKNS